MTETFEGAEFRDAGKMPRLFRDIVVSEKIDGTNAGIHFDAEGRVAAQSRNRLITPGDDNYGFAGWVYDNADSLFQLLGAGLHMGEWWGRGIQRRYDMDERRFSLFNAHRWKGEMRQGGDGEEYVEPVVQLRGGSITAVPVLFRGTFSEAAIQSALAELYVNGSAAAPGFMTPEGVCVYHSHMKRTAKVTLDNQDRHKWEAAA